MSCEGLILTYLYTLRHAKIGENLCINKDGKAETARLARTLKTEISSKKTVVICSPANRAVETAMIICEELAIVRPLVDECLFSCKDPEPEQLQEIYSLILEKAKSFEVIVLVTHAEITNFFPKYFVKEMFEQDLSTGESEKSCGWRTIINFNDIEAINTYIDCKR